MPNPASFGRSKRLFVLAINLFADGVQNAFYPRARAFKSRLG